MRPRFLSLENTSIWLDRLLQEEVISGDSEVMTFPVHKLGPMETGESRPFNSKEWNPTVSDIHEEGGYPKLYGALGTSEGQDYRFGRTERFMFATREFVLRGEEFAIESRTDGTTNFMPNTIVREELELERILGVGDAPGQNSLERNFLQALQIVCCGLAGPQVTVQEGVSVLGAETMNLLLLGAEVYSLIDGVNTKGSWCDRLWQHSLRVGYLSRIIAEGEGADTETIHDACAAGVLHDLGILVLTNSFQDVCQAIRSKAQRADCSLSVTEQSILGLSHGEVGAYLLQRWGVSDSVAEAVALHDEPFRSSTAGFTPLTAVYIANTLDGGGWPQDGDGVPTQEALEYLTVRGLNDHWPKWQKRLKEVTPMYSSP